MEGRSHEKRKGKSRNRRERGKLWGSEQLVALEEQSRGPLFNSYALTLKSKVVFRQ